MLLYVIRHGESETNLSHWTGWNDVNLTDKGRQDAARAGEMLKGIDFDAIYASDLTRALNTAQIALPGCQPKITPLLREINVGDLAGNPIDIVTAEERKELQEKQVIVQTKYADEKDENYQEKRRRQKSIGYRLGGGVFGIISSIAFCFIFSISIS